MEKTQIKAGLEIHQQLDTGKLFCNCPSLLRQDEPKFRVERKLNPVVGETGKIDVAAAHEKAKERTFIYEVYDTNCLVELDEEPPHALNEEALKIVLQIALLLNCKILPVTQIMRKTVVDGSNTSGFQRTAMIAYDGFIETSKGRVGIDTVMLEEDAARPSGKKDEDLEELGLENSKVYKLDRLGIPLVEIATAPDLKDPEQIKEAALKLGEIIRACKVKRGLGTIRQDLNISIKGDERVEIKGFQDPKIMIQTVEREVERQTKLTEVHQALKKVPYEFEEIADVSEIFKNTNCRFVKAGLDRGDKLLACRFPGFKGLFGKELYEGKRFGTEVSEYAKMFGVGGMIHSDEDLAKYNFSEKELADLTKKLDMKKGDAFIMIVGKNADRAIESAMKRVRMQFDYAVVKEVRRGNPDGSTSFLRPMPSAARMYPETDLPLLKISREMINWAKNNLPKLKSELRGYLQKEGLNDEMIKLILEEEKVEEFKELLNVAKNPSLVAKALVVFPREIKIKLEKSQEEIDEKLSFDVIERILGEVDKKIAEGDVRGIMQKIASGESFEQAVKKDNVDLEGELKKLIKEKPGLSANAYMGLMMAKFKGRVNGKEVMDIIGKLVR